MAHQAGSAAGLERLMEEYGTGLLRLCALQLGDAALAEDAAQETLLRAWRRYGTFRGEAAERTWITAIALNVCRDLLRSPWHTHRMELSALAEPAAEDAPWDYEEFTLEEIADTLGIVPGTVSARLTRAKRKLRPMLEEWYYD